MTTRPALYALLAGVLLTTAVSAWDAANPGAALPSSMRAAAASLTGPLLTTMADAFPAPQQSAREATELTAQLALTENELRTARGSEALARADHIVVAQEQQHRIVLSRVVAVGALGPSGPERLTLDVGSDNGVAVDQTVVAAAGLVGRTIRVGDTTSDVLLLGAPDLVVAARGQNSGLLGTVAPPAAGETSTRTQGQLTFTAIDFGDLVQGETLRTVGSPDNTPFVAGIPIGTISVIDPARGQVGTTAAVIPSIDRARLDVVAVIVPGAG